MPGMNSGLNIGDPTVVAAFQAALLHQGLIALLIFALAGLAWLTVRAFVPAAARLKPAGLVAEPSWRQVLRVGFGLLWVFDGILQAQSKMAVGLPSQVIQPAAASSPHWVQIVVNWAGTAWSYHPMQAGAAAVWIQTGIGLWLLAAARGPLSRLAGAASVGWGLVVWVFGEAFGGIFAPGLTWLFGAPGAVLIYCVAGGLIALPDRVWRAASAGRLMLAALGAFLLGMAFLQTWPGRGFWQGTAGGKPGTLAGMTSDMSSTPQPHLLAGWVSGFTTFDQAHGFAVNLIAIVALATVGAAFLTGRPRIVLPGLAVFIVLCAADWVFVEDIGFFGGLGTDPNSMIPFALLAVAGYLALTRAPAAQPVTAPETAEQAAASSGDAAPGRRAASWRDRLRTIPDPRALASASISSVVAVGAIGMTILGAAPLAAAQANPVADTILAEAIDGSSAPLNSPAPAFTLTDQAGRPVTLAGLRGKVVLLTFLDPVCTSDCPLIAQEFREAGQLLSASANQVALVAVNYNPLYTQVSYLQAFDQQEGLNGVRNWKYLTGTPAQLARVWARYGAGPAEVLPAGAMIGHGDYAFVIDKRGHIRRELDFDPGPGTQSTKSSFAAELAGAARPLLGSS
jgi:cytochrome oxidase Cu insertion factor (SCO1/SenC/PrrC family)